MRRGSRPQGRRYTRYTLGGVVVGAAIAGAALLASGPGAHRPAAAARAAATATATTPVQTQHVARVPLRRRTAGASGAAASAAGAVGAGGQAAVAEAPDPEASDSSPAPATIHHSAATTPSAAGDKAQVAAGAPSDAEVRRELAQMNAALKAQAQQAQQAQQAPPGGGSIGGSGAFTPPPGVPAVVARVIAGGNAIADFPYVFGGGHASFVDSAYDCSGSVSYALAAGGMLSAPETSGDLMSWGAPGPGKWITVYASVGHVYMYVDGMRFDTSFRSGVFGSRWQAWRRTNAGFVARHWPGL